MRRLSCRPIAPLLPTGSSRRSGGSLLAWSLGWACAGQLVACLPSPMIDEDRDQHLAGVDDCDDRASDIHPGALEVCDGLDNDCSGTIDDVVGTPCPVAPDADQDRDGFTPGQGDCRDDDPTIYPGAVDVCGDSIDSDCVGGDPECIGGLENAAARLIGEVPGDTAGASLATADLTGDGYPDLVVGAPYHSEAGAADGAVYVIAGPLPGGSFPLSAADVRLLGEWDSRAGSSLAAGDFNCDGQADLAVGAPSEGSDEQGSVYVLFGPLEQDGSLPERSDLRLAGLDAGSYFGAPLANAGDFNGDGCDDLAAAAPDAEDAAGNTYLFVLHEQVPETIQDAYASFPGEDARHFSGVAISAAGDQNGDGYGELAICADFYSSEGLSSRGACYVVFGPGDGPRPLQSANIRIEGENAEDHFGAAVSLLGDITGDGRPELAVGAPDYKQNGNAGVGIVYILSPRSLGVWSAGEAEIRLVGPDTAAVMGASLSSGADFNGDGHLDLIVGAPTSRLVEDERGLALPARGPLSTSRELELTSDALIGLVPEAYAGLSLLPLKGALGDDRTALVVGAPGVSSAAELSGDIYVVFLQ